MFLWVSLTICACVCVCACARVRMFAWVCGVCVMTCVVDVYASMCSTLPQLKLSHVWGWDGKSHKYMWWYVCDSARIYHISFTFAIYMWCVCHLPDTRMWYLCNSPVYGIYVMVFMSTFCRVTCRVSFAKEPYKRDDILQKRPIILRSLLIEATP